MARFWSEAVFMPEPPANLDKSMTEGRLVVEVAGGSVIFTLHPGAHPTPQEVEEQAATVLADLANAEE
jgi:hypothetical protein